MCRNFNKKEVSKVLITVQKHLLKLILKSVCNFPKVSKFCEKNCFPKSCLLRFSSPWHLTVSYVRHDKREMRFGSKSLLRNPDFKGDVGSFLEYCQT